MVKPAAILFGVVFLLVGILGYVPAATSDMNGMPMLLGIFHVNSAHNIVHLASGIVFLLCGLSGAAASQLFFRIFGVVYALVAVLGFMKPEGPLLGMVSNNVADTWLHVGLATAMLVIGFVLPANKATA
jgi:hypothetical protein